MVFSKHKIAVYYQLLFLLIVVIYSASCGVGRHIPTAPPVAVSAQQQEIINFGMQFIGVRYQFGGRTPSGFDCSGFTSYVFRHFGIHLNPTSATQDTQFPTISRREDLRVGDLVFFEGRTRNGRVGHVGIVSEVRPSYFRFIHASTSQGVTVSRSTEQYWAVRYLRGGRVLSNEVMVASNQGNARRVREVPVRGTGTTNVTQNNVIIPVASVHPTSAQSPVNEPVVLVNQTGAPVSNNQSNSNDNPPIVLINNSILRREDATNPEVTSESHRTYLVQAGDTLFSISRQFNVTVEQIRQWNPQMGDVLRAGETLIIRH